MIRRITMLFAVVILAVALALPAYAASPLAEGGKVVAKATVIAVLETVVE